MARREENRTDDSIVSVTNSLKSLMASSLRAAGELSGLTFLDDTALRAYAPEQILNRMLSTKSYISTASSAAGHNQQAHSNPEQRYFEKIGEGQCGTVWALIGTTEVVKVTKEGKSNQLWNDTQMHKTVEEAFQQAFFQLRKDISIPQLGQWVHPTNQKFWNEYIGFFPKGTAPTYGLISNRIFPLPVPVRAAIFDAFAPKPVKAIKEAFLKRPENKDCLVRLYLGRRETRSASKEFRLRNFDLTVGEMEYLRLDTEMYTIVMAQSLAIMHWKAGVDANDVEFVLGSSPAIKTSLTAAEFKATNKDEVRFITQELDFHHRSVAVWLLDFDQCQSFSENKQGLDQLKRGFWHNDPYYPRPVSANVKDVELWTKFKTAYLDASASLTNSGMPAAFISAIEEEGRKRRAGGSIFQ